MIVFIVNLFVRSSWGRRLYYTSAYGEVPSLSLMVISAVHARTS